MTSIVRILGAAIAVIGLGAAAASADDEIHVVTSTSGLIFAPVYIAKQEGYFKELGLDVDVQDGNGGSNAVASIVGDSAQIGFVGIKNASQAVVKGQALKVVGTGTQGFPQVLVARKALVDEAKIAPDAPLSQKGALLRNRIVAVTDIGGSTGEFARFILKQANVAENEVTLVNITTIPGQLAALKAGKIDAFVNTSPASELAVSEGYGAELVVPYRDLKDVTDFEYTVQTVREDYLTSNADVVTRYLQALQRSLDLIRKDPDRAKAATFAFLAEAADSEQALDPSIQDLSWRNALPYFPKTVALDPKRLAAARTFFGISDKAPDSVLVDNHLAEAVASGTQATN